MVSLDSDCKARTSQSGVVYVEFLICFFPFFLMFLAMIQLSFLYVGKLVVSQAAARAVRAAVVVLDDEPNRYGGAPRNCLYSTGEEAESSWTSDVITFLQAASSITRSDEFNNTGQLEGLNGFRGGNLRQQAIRSAAYMPLMTLAPQLDALGGDLTTALVNKVPSLKKYISTESIGSAIGHPVVRLAVSLFYNMGAVAVTFPDTPESTTSYVGDFSNKRQINVRVTYLFHCGIPVVNYLMCTNLYSMLSGAPIDSLRKVIGGVSEGNISPSKIRAWKNALIQERQRLLEMRPLVAELTAAENPGLQLMIGAGQGRFKILQAVASMPTQTAQYKYPSELEQMETGADEQKCQPPSSEAMDTIGTMRNIGKDAYDFASDTYDTIDNGMQMVDEARKELNKGRDEFNKRKAEINQAQADFASEKEKLRKQAENGTKKTQDNPRSILEKMIESTKKK